MTLQEYINELQKIVNENPKRADYELLIRRHDSKLNAVVSDKFTKTEIVVNGKTRNGNQSVVPVCMRIEDPDSFTPNLSLAQIYCGTEAYNDEYYESRGENR